MQTGLFAVLTIAALGCGGEFTADGAVRSHQLQAKDAVLHSVRGQNGAVLTEVLLGDVDDLCAQMGNNPGLLLNGQTTLFFELAMIAPGGVV